ncbi:MAG: hypothetical protein DMF78_11375 [Acidobacteria bacterium]|nr:MAG: hypothetical protein DMF78_11375 [Acidobacteriota bacterium]
MRCDPARHVWGPARSRGGRVAVALIVLLVAVAPAAVVAAKRPSPPPLPTEFRHPSGAFTFRTPEGWKVETPPESPETMNAGGDGVLVRFIYRAGESGYDSLHGACMLERLAPAMDMEPVVQYEYDYVGGLIANRRALDSAFVVRYDRPVVGSREWRQRNDPGPARRGARQRDLPLSGALALPLPQPRRQVWSIGGGKGGIGKSLLAASLGWYLARLGKRVVLVDADLGGANLHTCLGVPGPARTLGDFIQRRVARIEDVVVDTPFPRLQLISGASDVLGAANIKYQQKVRVLNRVRALDVDVVLLDLGAGTSNNILDFFLVADVSLLAVVPEPTSIENGYRFIKSALYRRLRMAAPTAAAREVIDGALDLKNSGGIRSPLELLTRCGTPPTCRSDTSS